MTATDVNRVINEAARDALRHYLIVRAKRREIIHHHRGSDGAVVTHSHVSGLIQLDPPGTALSVEEICTG